MQSAYHVHLGDTERERVPHRRYDVIDRALEGVRVAFSGGESTELAGELTAAWSFGFRHCFVIRHSAFVILSLAMADDQKTTGESDGAEDVRLMRLVARGDTAAFEELIERHQALVIGTVARMLGSNSE